MKPTYMRQEIAQTIQDIPAYDDLEKQHIQETLEWINSGAEIFRLKKPDIPNKHLVSYFIVFDDQAQKVLLCDHKKAQLWLPPGGHVDPGEHPRETARRECLEELQLEADFWQEAPLFITSTVTVGLTAGHTDVSLWYLLKGNTGDTYAFDEREFNTVEWFDLDAIPFQRSDPHMHRFVEKLKREVSYY